MKMRYVAIAESDIGIARDINQDSVLIKHATYGSNEVLMAIVCDGMGGLSRGEIASATVIREFEKWFIKELPFELKKIDMNVIGYKWSLLLRSLNISIREYVQKFSERLGTTFTGTLFINNQFVVVHVGDTRLYHIDTSLKQMTNDHTYVAREILKGTLTPEQANTDKHRNMLLQCIGASKTVEPQIICGEVKQGIYMLCSDGFRHKVTEEELIDSLTPQKLKNKRIMIKNSKQLIKLIKQRGEKDNISVIVIKSYFGENSEVKIKLSFIEKMINSKTRAYLLATGLLTVSIAIFVIGLLCM
jgi:prpC